MNVEAHGIELSDDRYEPFEGIVGVGGWCTVFGTRDKATGQRLVAKVLTPGEIAESQARHRNITNKAYFVNEAGEMVAAGHIPPMRRERDKNGTYFVIMPRYEGTLYERILNENGSTKYLGNGLDIEEIFSILTDVSAGVEEGHVEFNNGKGKVHGDLHLENILVDRNNKWLVSDWGASTRFDPSSLHGPRDNIGCLYTRAPGLFAEDSRPSKESDGYALANIAYKLFTGKYLLEDEIDAEWNKGAQEGIDKSIDSYKARFKIFVKRPDVTKWKAGNVNNVREYAQSVNISERELILDWFAGGLSNLQKYMSQFSGESLNLEWEELRESKFTDVPKEFKGLLKRYTNLTNIFFRQNHSINFKSDLEEAIAQYRENQIKKSAISEYKKTLSAKIKKSFIYGASTAAFCLGLGGLLYFGPKPNFANLEDVGSQVQYRTISQVSFRFVSEGIHEQPEISTISDHDYTYGNRWFAKEPDAFANVLISETLDTASEVDFYLSEAKYRLLHSKLTRTVASMSPTMNDVMQVALQASILQNRLNNSETKPLIDFEDTVTQFILDRATLAKAHKHANSTDFVDYVDAINAEGKFIISRDEKAFLQLLLHRLQKKHPGLFVYD